MHYMSSCNTYYVITLLVLIHTYIAIQPIVAIVSISRSIPSSTSKSSDYHTYRIYRVGNITRELAFNVIKKIIEYISKYTVFEIKYPDSPDELKPITMRWIDAREYVFGYKYLYMYDYICTVESMGRKISSVKHAMVVIEVTFSRIDFSVYGYEKCIEFNKPSIREANVTKILYDLLELTGFNNEVMDIDIVNKTRDSIQYRLLIDGISYCDRCSYYSGYYSLVFSRIAGILDFSIPYFPSLSKVAEVSVEEYDPEEILAHGIDNAENDIIRVNTVKLLEKTKSTPQATMIYRGPVYMYTIDKPGEILIKPAYIYYVINVSFMDGTWHDIIVVIEDKEYRLLNFITSTFIEDISDKSIQGKTADPNRVLEIYNSLNEEEKHWSNNYLVLILGLSILAITLALLYRISKKK